MLLPKGEDVTLSNHRLTLLCVYVQPWGGARYRALWELAVQVGAQQEAAQETEQQQQQPDGHEPHQQQDASATAAAAARRAASRSSTPVQAAPAAGSGGEVQDGDSDDVDTAQERDDSVPASPQSGLPRGWDAAAAAEAVGARTWQLAVSRAGGAGPSAAAGVGHAAGLTREWMEELQPLLGRQEAVSSDVQGSSSSVAGVDPYERYSSVGYGQGRGSVASSVPAGTSGSQRGAAGGTMEDEATMYGEEEYPLQLLQGTAGGGAADAVATAGESSTVSVGMVDLDELD